MKKLSLFGLVAVLAVGLLSVGAFAAEKSDSTYVSWNYTCNAEINAHPPNELGEEFPNSDNVIDLGSGWVNTASNCGYDVYVEASETYSPGGATGVLNNFEITQDGSDRGTLDWSSGSSFNAIGYVSRHLGSVAVGTSTGNNNTWNVRYQFDADGQPAGEYRVDLTYTMTTTD